MKIFLYANVVIAVLIMTLNAVAAMFGHAGSGERGTQQLTLIVICLSAIWIHDAIVANKGKP